MQNLRIAFILLFGLHTALHAQPTTAEVMQNLDRLLLNSSIPEAIALIESASDQHPSLLLDNKKAEALVRLGSYDEAAKLLESIEAKVSAGDDLFLKAVTEGNLGFLQLNQGRNELAEASLKNALVTFEKAGKAAGAEAAQVVANLGLVYMSMGKYNQAQEQLHRALAIRESVMKNEDELIAATYNDLGLVYSQTDKDKALDYFSNAEKMYRGLYGNDHPKIAIASINMGIVYRDLEFYGDAVNNFDAALAISNKVYPGPHPTKAIALYNLGQTYVKMKDEATAMKYYQQAHEMYVACYGPKHPEVASVLNAIGNLQVSASAFDTALKTYQAALQANFPDFNNADVGIDPAIKNYYHGARLLYTLMFKEQAFEKRYLRKSLKFTDLTRALTILVKCDSLIDQLRQHSANEIDKLRLGDMANEVYADGVRIAHEAGLNALNKNHYFRLAFYFAEKSKSAVLLEAISDANAKSFAGIPGSLLEKENKLRSALTLTAEKLAQKPSPEEEKKLRETSFGLKQEYESFIRNLEDEYPGYFNLKFNFAAPSIADLQALLNNKTALLSYFIDEKNNQLYIFLIGRNKYQIFERPLPKLFDKYLTGLKNSLYFDEIRTFKMSAYELGHLLMPPVPSSVTDLVVIPTGRLALVPFETLLSRPAGKDDDYRRMPYLANRFNIRYEFSAGLILQKKKKEDVRRQPSIFLCAPVSFTGQHLSDLPGTESEVNQISALFAGKKLAAEAYTGSRADEKLVKDGGLKGFDFVHFATHGIVDESDPELSRIFLHPDAGLEDGNLFAGEIYNLELDASLVTLSACQTGLGKIQQGEGVIGLSRALVYAGARNLLVSFWNVADESTAVLMKNFYQRTLENPAPDYSGPLREAKLDLLRNEKYAAPFYWAPFVLIGF